VELNNRSNHCEVKAIAIGPGVLCEGGGLSSSPEEAEAIMGKLLKTPQRRRKKKGLLELGVSNSHPRRSTRLSTKSSQAGILSQSRQGMSSVYLSAGDIDNCNQWLFVSEPVAEPSKLWEISRRVGITCRLDEQEVIQEYSCLEARDLEFMKSVEEGKGDGFA